jgi:hypothetical protein
MCILPSRLEFDELEAREREFEKELAKKLETLPEAEREARKLELLRLNVLRFAGIMAVADAH